MELNNEALHLENQICFPLYACAKEIVKRYRPFLEEIDLTYTQFITMIVLWENGSISAKEIGRKLFLDSGTLTPVLKSLAKKGFITRERSKDDERVLMIDLTEKGRELQKEAFDIPAKVTDCVNFNAQDAKTLYTLLNKLLGQLD